MGPTDRDFWQRVLSASGSTTIPRWSAPTDPPLMNSPLTDPPPEVAEHEVAVGSTGGITAREFTVAEILAAHAKVIAALQGAAGADRVPSGRARG